MNVYKTSTNKNSYNKKIQSFKKRNLTKEMAIMDLFHFVYAGKADIYIFFQKGFYYLVIDGVHIVENIYCFTPNHTHRYKFEKLYTAILAFNTVVNILINSMDWYYPDMFDKYIYDEVTVLD